MENIYDGMKPSKVIQSFLDWLAEMRDEQEAAWETVKKEDEKVQDFLHEIEFEKSSKKRALIDTRLHNSRVARRAAKDKSSALKPITVFVGDVTNRGFIKRMKKLQYDLKEQEDFLASERVYKPRAQEQERIDG